MRDKKLILFDMDGVLIDTSSLLKKTYVELAQYLKGSLPPEGKLREAIRMSPRMAISQLFGDQSCDAYYGYSKYWKCNIRQASAFPGIVDLLADLVSRGIIIGTATSRNKADTMGLLAAAGLIGYMNVVITWGRYRIDKPSPACILTALSDTGIPASKAAYVGDQAIDIQAARYAEVLAVGAVWDTETSRPELEKAGAHIIIEEPCQVALLLNTSL